MKVFAFYSGFVILLFCLLASSSAFGVQSNPQSVYLNKYISNMISHRQSAFISECVATSSTTQYDVELIFFPRRNSGLFVIKTAPDMVSNMGKVWLSNTGRWELADLEGGIDTIRILGDLFGQLTRLKFKWVEPSRIARVESLRPKVICRLFGNEGFNPVNPRR